MHLFAAHNNGDLVNSDMENTYKNDLKAKIPPIFERVLPSRPRVARLGAVQSGIKYPYEKFKKISKTQYSL